MESVTINQSIPYHILDEMFATTNGYLAQLGIGIEIEDSDSTADADYSDII
jgi:hypothetical protein